MTGRDWTVEELQAAIDWGPHQLALMADTIDHFQIEVAEKVAASQAKVVLWEDNIRSNPLPQLKVSLVVAIAWWCHQ